MINSITIKNFTAFKELSVKFTEGINVFIGANSTGKSHLLKLMYALCAANKPLEKELFGDPKRYITSKLKGVFKPEGKIGRLCRNDKKAIIRADLKPNRFIEFAFSNDMDEVVVTDNMEYERYSWEPVFIPPKEMLSIFEGFSSLYLKRELTIDETYFDLCQAIETPVLKAEQSLQLSNLIKKIKVICEGEFLLVKQKKFYYKPTKGEILEVELAAEGFRKLGVLQRLIETGHILPGVSGPLFWDEPESNLNPSLVKHLISILLEMAREGQQIFLATHDHVVLKWLDLLRQDNDHILFHALYKNDENEIEISSTNDYLKICPNAIDTAYAELVDKDIENTMGGLGK
ncbi:AAA family ATPase [Desulfobacterium sp. N47]|uniref:ATPase AAA-type core domain-containing protein n=1 Tax=uncultured Desulfobacterium sp. TaxID=201089 RepID=E1Y8A0_9BACT|nr:hypothetical protein N47_A08230 [uncultured Desulfobacterium sp.]